MVQLLSPFAVDWEQLDLAALQTFLDTPVDESLTWEGKGGDIRPEHIQRAASGFGNSVLGGFVVLGVTQAGDKTWTRDGWVPPQTEVETWVSHCLRGVRPRPYVEVKAWSLDDGGTVAVVAIWPASIP